MKILITWKFHEGKLHDTLLFFSKMTEEEERTLMGDKIKLIGRWHDLIGGKGVAIFESESAEAIVAYSLNWRKYMDLDLSVVTDDAETRSLGKQMSLGT